MASSGEKVKEDVPHNLVFPLAGGGEFISSIQSEGKLN